MFKLLIISFFLCTGIVYSQTYLQESNTEFSNLQKTVKQNVLSQLANSPVQAQSTSNSIYIEQIGNFNNVVSLTQSLTSDINISQKGNNNSISQSIISKNIKSTLIQNGSGNQILNNAEKSHTLHTTNVIQQGQDLSLKIYGSNSLSDKITIKMTGNSSKAITMRNY